MNFTYSEFFCHLVPLYEDNNGFFGFINVEFDLLKFQLSYFIYKHNPDVHSKFYLEFCNVHYSNTLQIMLKGLFNHILSNSLYDQKSWHSYFSTPDDIL